MTVALYGLRYSFSIREAQVVGSEVVQILSLMATRVPSIGERTVSVHDLVSYVG